MWADALELTSFSSDKCFSFTISKRTRFSFLLAFGGAMFAAAPTVSPTSLSFGNQVLSVPSAAQQITFTNGSGKTIAITSITNGLADYTQTNTCPISPATLAANATCTISVTFTPAALGLRSDTLQITSNSNTIKVPLSGSGIAAVTLSPASVSFSNQVVGTKSGGKNVTVKNNKSSSVTITGITSSLSDFSNTTTCPLSPNTLAGGSSCSVTVFFTPAAVGTRTGTLTVSTDAGAPTASLTGAGVVAVSVNPTTLSFAGQALGTASAAQPVTLTNNQSKAITITSVSSSGDFADTTTCPLSPNTLAAGASCTASVTFSPKNTGASTGTLTFNDNASSTPQTVTLTGTGNPAALLSIAVTPANASFANGTTQQFTATGTYTDGSTLDITGAVTWSTAGTSIAGITSSGLATGNATGGTTVTATSGSISGSTALTVTAATLVSITVTPAIPALPLGLHQQFAATGTYTDASTQDLTATASWSSSQPGIASISSSAGSNGLATGVAPGATNIAATIGTISGGTTLTVTAAAVVSIAVSPASPSIALGTNQQFTATATMSDGSTQNVTTSAVWNCSAPGVASVSTGGLATGGATGSAVITATVGTVGGSAVLSVTAAQLVSIAVTPALGSVAAGLTDHLTAIGTYTDGSSQDITSLGNWSSSDGTVATVSNTPGSQGLASTLRAGSTTITISLGGVSGSATLSVTAAVLASISITSGGQSLAMGAVQQFTATGTFSDGTAQDITGVATWSSSNAAVAVVSAGGVVSTAAAGTATITATLGSISGSVVLTVTGPVPVGLSINPAGPSIFVGAVQQFAATVTYSDTTTQDVTALAAWNSSMPGVATISPSGAAAGVAAGGTTITASYAGLSGSTTLAVSVVALASITVAPSNPSLAMGGTLQLSATGTYSDGSAADISGLVQWGSGAQAIAAVNAQGLLTGALPGSALITATLGTITGSTTATVAAPQSITCERNLLYPGGNYFICYPAGYALDTTLPVMVFLHGGEWTMNAIVAGPRCPDSQSVACAILNMGYVYYDVNYTLMNQLPCGTLTVGTDGQTIQCSTYAFTAADVGDGFVTSVNSSGWVSGGYTVASVNTSSNPTTAKLCQIGDASCTLKVNTSGNTPSLESSGYALTQAGTTYPKSLDDIWCFLDWLGNHAGQSSPHAPGNPSNIKIFGPSAGGWLVEELNFAPRSAFTSSCTSEAPGNWKLTALMALSPVTDLYNLYWNADAGVVNDGGVRAAIRAYLGCLPGQANCPSQPASPDYWAGLYPPRAPMMIIGGALDRGVPSQDQTTTVSAAATLGVTIPYVLLPNEGHGLDWQESCPYQPACGTAGQVWANMQSFFFGTGAAVSK